MRSFNSFVLTCGAEDDDGVVRRYGHKVSAHESTPLALRDAAAAHAGAQSLPGGAVYFFTHLHLTIVLNVSIYM